jgi:hypothetical protein
LYLFFLMSGLILFLWAILLGIGLIWAIPIYLIAQAYIYIRITMKSTSESTESTETAAPVTQQTN